MGSQRDDTKLTVLQLVASYLHLPLSCTSCTLCTSCTSCTSSPYLHSKYITSPARLLPRHRHGRRRFPRLGSLPGPPASLQVQLSPDGHCVFYHADDGGITGMEEGPATVEVYPCTSSPALPLISLPACLACREHIWIPRRCSLLPTPQACRKLCASMRPSWRSQAPRHSQSAMGLTSSSWQEGGGSAVRGLGKAGGEAGGEAGGGAGGGEAHGSVEIG